MKKLEGKKTTTAAIGLLVAAIGAAVQKDWATAIQLGLNALAAWGLGNKLQRLGSDDMIGPGPQA